MKGPESDDTRLETFKRQSSQFKRPRNVPSPINPVVRAALTEAAEELRRLYGDRLERLVLYGSHARGEAHSESDVDVLFVLKDPVEAHWEIKKTSRLSMDLLLKHEVDIHLMPFSASMYKEIHHPLMMNVHEEGIEIPIPEVVV